MCVCVWGNALGQVDMFYVVSGLCCVILCDFSCPVAELLVQLHPEVVRTARRTERIWQDLPFPLESLSNHPARCTPVNLCTPQGRSLRGQGCHECLLKFGRASSHLLRARILILVQAS